MREWLLRAAVRRSLADIRHVVPVRPGAARPPVSVIYRQVEREFGVLAPPVVLHSPAPDLLVACWAMLRATLVDEGVTERRVREAVASAVSLSNRCPYCVDVHGETLRALDGGPDAAAVLAGRPDRSADPLVRTAAAWAAGSGPRPSGLDPRAVAELVGVAVTFQYVNRMVNVFLDESPLPAFAPRRVRDLLRWMLRATMRQTVARGRAGAHAGPPAGDLPAAPLPADLGWAGGHTAIQHAFAGSAVLVRARAAAVLGADARATVRSIVDGWDGAPPGPSRAWATDAVAGLPRADRPAARLALLTALASYQVDDAVVAEAGLRDADLLGLTSWASFTAARHLGTRMTVSALPGPRAGD
ncbi:alkylhydroperoxidase [Actinoplanes sp. ATCC 53533]|uniref:carboxymuconolactone decarboxylase family protein n=1 Tax=Actinoplanes sp. ATCC 53533 TaxID=1288362 RepID=UPI000F79BE7E|nr:carboxymuconolactone decarboxylase family protein [Actinoplanes sp. ATCC 53533]RSM47499.1 alkylhydroperoxidase [Actinoplanes sp. ATCC 53533]